MPVDKINHSSSGGWPSFFCNFNFTIIFSTGSSTASSTGSSTLSLCILSWHRLMVVIRLFTFCAVPKTTEILILIFVCLPLYLAHSDHVGFPISFSHHFFPNLNSPAQLPPVPLHYLKDLIPPFLKVYSSLF